MTEVAAGFTAAICSEALGRIFSPKGASGSSLSCLPAPRTQPFQQPSSKLRLPTSSFHLHVQLTYSSLPTATLSTPCAPRPSITLLPCRAVRAAPCDAAVSFQHSGKLNVWSLLGWLTNAIWMGSCGLWARQLHGRRRELQKGAETEIITSAPRQVAPRGAKHCV